MPAGGNTAALLQGDLGARHSTTSIVPGTRDSRSGVGRGEGAGVRVLGYTLPAARAGSEDHPQGRNAFDANVPAIGPHRRDATDPRRRAERSIEYDTDAVTGAQVAVPLPVEESPSTAEAQPRTPSLNTVMTNQAPSAVPWRAGLAPLAEPEGQPRGESVEIDRQRQVVLTTERLEPPEERAPNPDPQLMDRELAEATDGRGVARRQRGGPAVLEPQTQPEDPAAQAEQASRRSGEPRQATTPEAPTEGASQETVEEEVTAQAPSESAEEAAGGTAEADRAAAAAQETGAAASASVQAPAAAGESVAPAALPPVREQIPVREPSFDEFVEIVESGTTLQQDQMSVRSGIASLRATAEQAKARLLMAAETQKAVILAVGEARAVEITAAAAEATAAIRAEFAAAGTNLMQAAEAARAQVAAKLAEDRARIQADSDARVAEAEAALTERKTAFEAFAQNESQEPQRFAQQAVARADRELEAAAQQCIRNGERVAARYRGSDDPKPDQRQAARRVAAESAADIRAKKPRIAADLQERAAGFADNYAGYGTRIAQQIEEVRASLIPQMQAMPSRTIGQLEAGATQVNAVIDARVQGDLANLRATEEQSVALVDNAADSACAQVFGVVQESSCRIDQSAEATSIQIHCLTEDVASTLEGEAEPFTPGVKDVIDTTRSDILSLAEVGIAGMAEIERTTAEGMGQIAQSFRSQASDATAAASARGATAVADFSSAIDTLIATRDEGAAEAMTALQTLQRSLLADALAEIDSAIEAASGELRDVTQTFKQETAPATDEAIREAKKPLTDEVTDRAEEAAEEAGESWLSGLFRAVVDIAIGLVVLVVVALVIAAIAAAFGVILTAWTAIMIAGAILLLVGLGVALYSRFTQPELAEAPWYQKIGLAMFDTVGGTGIYQAIAGEDIVTGQTLDAGQRTHQGVTGTFTLVMLILGTRAAIKGPPGGTYVRPTGMPRGWVGWRNALPRGFEGARSVLVELYTGVRESGRRASDWIRDLFGRRRQVAAEPPVPEGPPRRGDMEMAEWRERVAEWRETKKYHERLSPEAVENAEVSFDNPRSQRWWDQASLRERQLALDAAHQQRDGTFLVNDAVVREAQVGIEAELTGRVRGPIRRSSGTAEEFFDAEGRAWDVKRPDNPASIAEGIRDGEHIMIDGSGRTTAVQFDQLAMDVIGELRGMPQHQNMSAAQLAALVQQRLLLIFGAGYRGPPMIPANFALEEDRED